MAKRDWRNAWSMYRRNARLSPSIAWLMIFKCYGLGMADAVKYADNVKTTGQAASLKAR